MFPGTSRRAGAFSDRPGKAEECDLPPIRRPIRAVRTTGRAAVIARTAFEVIIEPPLPVSVRDGRGDGFDPVARQVGDGSANACALRRHGAVIIRIEA